MGRIRKSGGGCFDIINLINGGVVFVDGNGNLTTESDFYFSVDAGFPTLHVPQLFTPLIAADNSFQNGIDLGSGSLFINGATAVNWSGFALYDSPVQLSVNWDTRYLFNTSQIISVGWNDHQLYDGGGISSVHWAARLLQNLGGVATIDWANQHLLDITASLPTVDWQAQTLSETGTGSVSVDWNNRFLVDRTGATVVDWSLAQLIDPGSFVGTVKWLDQLLVDLNSGNTALDWGNRILIDQSSTTALSWASASGVLIKQVGTYNGDSTAGNGIVSIVGSVALTNQSASITTTTLFAVSHTGLYRVSVYLVDTSTGTAGTAFASIGWTDDKQAQTNTTGTLNLTVSGAFVQSTFVLEAKSGTNITYSTTVAGALGSPKFSLYIAAERLQ